METINLNFSLCTSVILRATPWHSYFTESPRESQSFTEEKNLMQSLLVHLEDDDFIEIYRNLAVYGSPDTCKPKQNYGLSHW
jgi:hypothetical protein